MEWILSIFIISLVSGLYSGWHRLDKHEKQETDYLNSRLTNSFLQQQVKQMRRRGDQI